MKKRILTSALALCMVLSLSVPAMAAEATVPEVTDMSITHNGSPVNRDVVNGSYIFTFPTTTASNAADYTASVTLSEGSMFTASSPADDNTGELYVEEVNGNEVTLKFNMTVDVVDLNDDEYALTLVSAGSNTWTGGFENATDLPLTTMATYLTSRNIYLTAGALGSGSEAQDILVNMDDEKVVFVLCNPDAVVYTVDYVVDEDTTITWELPAGAEIPEIAVELSGGQEIEGWYTDADCTNAFVEGTTVTGNTTVYAKVSVPTEDKTFLEKLEDHENVTITNKTEWDTFVENSDVVVAGQLITLGTDIDCGNAIYDSMTFKGNFNGNGKTISNATFRAVDSAYYTSSENDIVCSGMFAALGAGQTIANLTLEDITAEFSTTYSGVLAGLADGTSSNPVLIQNVQVRDSSASGRTAAGVVGFTRNTTVRYCSSTGTTITGLANGGGVVGINNAHVEYCYSTSTPTALTFLGGSVGGVISKNVRGGNNNYCWAYMQVVGAEEDGPGQNLNSLEANASMSYETFYNNGFTQYCWTMSDNGPAEFDPDEVSYNFGSNS